MADTNRRWAAEVGVEPARRELAPTAERILKAARRVLVKKGYAALTMQEIEKESGTNRALVHYYFGSKAGLVDALVETLFEDPAFGYSDEVMQAPEGEQRRKALLAWLLRIVARPSLRAPSLRAAAALSALGEAARPRRRAVRGLPRVRRPLPRLGGVQRRPECDENGWAR